MGLQLPKAKKDRKPFTNGGSLGYVVYPSKYDESSYIHGAYPMYAEKCVDQVTVSVFSKITRGFFKFIAKKILEGYQVELPSRCGKMYVKGTKIKVRFNEEGKPCNLAPDWKLTKELWARDEQARLDNKKIYHTNDHSNGIRYKVRWYKRDLNIENKTFYSFRLSENNQQALSKLIFGGKEFIVENY